jgi:hypothetical protein
MIGSAAGDAKLDVQAKENASRELDRWVVESCNSNVDLVNAMVRQGLVSGREVKGADRTAGVDKCIQELKAARKK